MLVIALPTKFCASATSAISRDTIAPDWCVWKNEWLTARQVPKEVGAQIEDGAVAGEVGEVAAIIDGDGPDRRRRRRA